MASKGVVDREKSAQSVISSAMSNKGKINEELHKVLESYFPDGEELPDFKRIFDALICLLKEKRDKMVVAYNAHMLEQKEDRAARITRNERIVELYNALVVLRGMVSNMYDGPSGELLRFSGKTPKEPLALDIFAQEVVIALRIDSLPEPKVLGTSIDTGFWADKIEALRVRLNNSVENLGNELRQSEQTMITKNQAVADYDEYFARTANALVGLFRLAGEKELAKRVRPSTRKPGRTLQAEDSEPDKPDDP